jgi:hypothetical protein
LIHIDRKALTSESLHHEYSTKRHFQAQSSGWLLVELPNETLPTREREQRKLYEPLRSLKLDAEEFVVAFTEDPYRNTGCAFVWPGGTVAEGPAGLAGEECLLLRDCGLSGGEGIDGIDPRAELALEML